MDNKVIWTIRALKGLELISDYYLEISIKASEKIIFGILGRTRQLEIFSESGRKYESPQKTKFTYRRLVEGNYLIVYRIEKNIIYIATVFDSRQEPSKLKLE